jgi:hypothetical protein
VICPRSKGAQANHSSGGQRSRSSGSQPGNLASRKHANQGLSQGGFLCVRALIYNQHVRCCYGRCGWQFGNLDVGHKLVFLNPV